MKTATGEYYNLYSEAGYDNLGLNKDYDILIVFIESFKLTRDIVDTLDLMMEGCIRGQVAAHGKLLNAEKLKDGITKCLDALCYEYERVYVNAI